MSSEYDKKNEPGQTEAGRDKSAAGRPGQNPESEGEQKEWREGQGGRSSQPGKPSETEPE